MHKLFLGGLVTTISTTGVFALPCMARGGDDWKSLDRDIEALVASSSNSLTGEPTVHGLVRADWAYLPDVIPTAGGPEDLAGFRLDNVQVSLEGRVGEKVGYMLELEAAGGTAVLLDGYGSWDACSYVRLTMGQFRSPLLWESQLSDGSLLFILRTDSGQLFYTRDQGAMLSGASGPLHWAAAVQNGLDSVADRISFSARVGVDAIGGGIGPNQGAYGSGSNTKLSLGAGYFDDSSQGSGKDGDVFAADAQFQMGRFAADAMMAVYQDFTDPLFVSRTDSKPWSATASFMVIEEKVEVAARYQDTDNVLDEKDVTAGINYYLDGHAVKAQLNVSYIFSDNDVLDDSIRVGVGANVRI